MTGNIESNTIEKTMEEDNFSGKNTGYPTEGTNNAVLNNTTLNTLNTVNTVESVKPWSAKATLGFTLVLFILYVVLSVVLAKLAGFFVDSNSASSLAFIMDGDFIAVSYILTALCLSPMLFLWARKRKLTTAAAYLGFDKLPNKKTFLNFNLALIAYFIFSYFASDILAIETPQMIIDIYNSTDYFFLLLIAVVIAAPIFEELVFRGFIFKGLKHSPIGVTGAIIITSILFTLIHGGQYEIAILAILFPLAVILGFARHRSGGILLPIYLHFANNLYSTVEMYLLMN
jgi:hypothetical protein